MINARADSNTVRAMATKPRASRDETHSYEILIHSSFGISEIYWCQQTDVNPSDWDVSDSTCKDQCVAWVLSCAKRFHFANGMVATSDCGNIWILDRHMWSVHLWNFSQCNEGSIANLTQHRDARWQSHCSASRRFGPKSDRTEFNSYPLCTAPFAPFLCRFTLLQIPCAFSPRRWGQRTSLSTTRLWAQGPFLHKYVRRVQSWTWPRNGSPSNGIPEDVDCDILKTNHSEREGLSFGWLSVSMSHDRTVKPVVGGHEQISFFLGGRQKEQIFAECLAEVPSSVIPTSSKSSDLRLRPRCVVVHNFNGSFVMDQSGVGWFSGWIEIFVIFSVSLDAEFWSTWCEDCFSTEQNHP